VNGRTVESPHLERGYLVLEGSWSAGDEVELILDTRPRPVYARPEVGDAAGKAAIQRGPFILCAESADNGPGLSRLELDASAPIVETPREDPILGRSLSVEARGRRALDAEAGSGLYCYSPIRYEDCAIRLIPYFQWANRGEGEMRVWLRTR
jgi:uncharacterized protein